LEGSYAFLRCKRSPAVWVKPTVTAKVQIHVHSTCLQTLRAIKPFPSEWAARLCAIRYRLRKRLTAIWPWRDGKRFHFVRSSWWDESTIFTIAFWNVTGAKRFTNQIWRSLSLTRFLCEKQQYGHLRNVSSILKSPHLVCRPLFICVAVTAPWTRTRFLQTERSDFPDL